MADDSFHDTPFDALETRPPAEREEALFERFGERLAAAAERLPGLRAHLDGHDVAAVASRADLARLPVLRKDALMAAQRDDPPFGGFVDTAALGGTRAFMSPGPVFEVQPPGRDPWESARALHAAGFRPGMTVHNAFAYHLTPGGFILDEGALALGCTVLPAGTGNTELQVEAIRRLRPAGWTGTPDYLATLLDHAAGDGAEGEPAADGRVLDSIRVALVSGGALFPSLRERYAAAGIAVSQCYATADAGVIAYETRSADGSANPGMVVSENLIVELCHPGSGEPVGPGERGEVVVTRLEPVGDDGRPGPSVAPLLRFATGDLSAFLDEPSPCGRTNRRLAGWLGRADQRTKVRGMFVDPVQVQRLRAEHAAVERLRLVVAREGERDVMTLRAALAPGADADGVAVSLKRALRRETGLDGRVEFVDSLPADGIVVEDRRDYG